MIVLYSILVFTILLVVLGAALAIAERFLANYGTCRIDINAGERPLDIDGGQSLMAALIGAGIYIPAACGGQGTCGRCKVEVLSGGGSVGLTERPYLSRREIRDGVRLACQVKVRGDMAVRIPEEILNVKLYDATVVAVRRLTGDICEVRLKMDDSADLTHRPGQYVQVRAPSEAEPVFRAYSISSPAWETAEVALLVRRVPGGLASEYLHRLRPDDRVTFTGPYGSWRMSDDESIELICVAGGVGLAPIRSIVHTLCRTQPNRTCRLFLGCRTVEDVLCKDEFDRLAVEHPNFHFTCALSDEPADSDQWAGRRGYIHLVVDDLLTPGPHRQAYLCGPPPMIEAVTRVLQAKGVRPEDIYCDEF